MYIDHKNELTSYADWIYTWFYNLEFKSKNFRSVYLEGNLDHIGV